MPSECGTVKKFRDGKKWAHKFTQEQAKLLAEKYESQSKYSVLIVSNFLTKHLLEENEPKKTKPHKSKTKTTKSKTSRPKKTHVKSNSSTKGKGNIFGTASSQSCYIITNLPTSTSSPNLITSTSSGKVTKKLYFHQPPHKIYIIKGVIEL